MVIIAVANLPMKMNLKGVVKDLASTIKCFFEALNFTTKRNIKTVYIRLAQNADVNQVLTRLNNKKLKSVSLHAFVPDVVPDLPLSAKPKAIPTKMRRKLCIAADYSQEELVNKAMYNILKEMQQKFTGLFDLSLGTGHHLLDNIGKTVAERLYKIVQSDNGSDNGFILTKTYRRRHPHFADFQFILSTLHAIQDSQGKPRDELQEKDFTTVALGDVNTLPYEVMQPILNQHIDRISNKIQEHVTNLEVVEQTENPEEAALMTVRHQLKKIKPHLRSFIRQIITNHFMPTEDAYCLVKVYGEPYLPNKEQLAPFFKQFRVVSTIRSEIMFNHISLKVPKATHVALLNADGSMINNAKLVIRPAKVNIYKDMKRCPQPRAPAPRSPSPDNRHQDEKDPQEMEWSEMW